MYWESIIFSKNIEQQPIKSIVIKLKHVIYQPNSLKLIYILAYARTVNGWILSLFKLKCILLSTIVAPFFKLCIIIPYLATDLNKYLKLSASLDKL